jgi:hypothetical protein
VGGASAAAPSANRPLMAVIVAFVVFFIGFLRGYWANSLSAR